MSVIYSFVCNYFIFKFMFLEIMITTKQIVIRPMEYTQSTPQITL